MLIPKILASSPKGKFASVLIKRIVVVPPLSMLAIAAFQFVCLKNIAAIKGTNKPDTMNA